MIGLSKHSLIIIININGLNLIPQKRYPKQMKPSNVCVGILNSDNSPLKWPSLQASYSGSQHYQKTCFT